MTTDIEKLAREAGATFYRNRHVEKPSITFVNDQLRAFAESFHAAKLARAWSDAAFETTQDGATRWRDPALHYEAAIAALQERIKVLEAALRKYDEATAWVLGGEPIDTLMIEAHEQGREALKENTNG